MCRAADDSKIVPLVMADPLVRPYIAHCWLGFLMDSLDQYALAQFWIALARLGLWLTLILSIGIGILIQFL